MIVVDTDGMFSVFLWPFAFRYTVLSMITSA
jgi:hypothetical protein